MKAPIAIAMSSIILLSACGGGGSSSSGSDQGSLSVSLTDAPVDDAANVFVTIRGISLNLEEVGWVDYDIEGVLEPTDLLALQAGNTINLFDSDSVEAGTYEVRLNLTSDSMDHYIIIEEGGAQHELFIPSGDQLV